VRRALAAAGAAAVLVAAAGVASRDPAPGPAFAVVEVARGLTRPVQVVAGPEGQALVVGQDGTVRTLDPPHDLVLDLRRLVRFDGEQGLLGLQLRGGGADARAYVHYTDRGGDTRVVELAPGAQGSRVLRTLLEVDQPHPNHKGGNLAFGLDGRLYLGLGDGGGAFDADDRSQSPDTRLGKVLRLDVDRPGAEWEVVAIGARNPWRLTVDAATGDLWIADVGQDRQEEVDRLPAGLAGPVNLGWPRREGHAVHAGRVQRGDLPYRGPELVYGRGRGCSIVGGPVVRGAGRPLRDRYLYGDLCSGRLWSVPVGEDGVAGDPRAEDVLVPGLVSVDELPSGRLLATSFYGYVYELRPG
jgi:glucose/arabinose dehydrogenase